MPMYQEPAETRVLPRSKPSQAKPFFAYKFQPFVEAGPIADRARLTNLFFVLYTVRVED